MDPQSAQSPLAPERREHSHFVTEYLALLLRWKRAAILLCGLIVVLAALEALILPPVFKSEVRILPVGESSLLDNANVRALSEFSPLIDFTSWGTTGKSALLSLLDSDLLRVRVAGDLDLVARFGIDDPDSAIAVHLAARELRETVAVSINKWDAIIIEAEGNDPQFPIDLLQSIVTQLRTIQNEMSLTSGKRTRQFVEQRIAEAEVAYRQAQEALTAFQNEHGLVVVDEQQRALVRLAAELETQLTLKRAELDATRSFFSGEHSRVRQLEAEIGALEGQRSALLGSIDTAPAPGESLSPDLTRPSLAGLPDLAAQYVRLAMDLEIQTRLLALLAEQHEQAKISEVREVTSFEVIDPPRLPADAKRTPLGILLAGAVIGVLAALLFPLLLDSLNRYFPSEARRDAVELLRRLGGRVRAT